MLISRYMLQLVNKELMITINSHTKDALEKKVKRITIMQLNLN